MTDKLNYMVSIRCGCYFSRTYFTYRDDALQYIREEVDSLENTKLEHPLHIEIESNYAPSASPPKGYKKGETQ